KLRVLESVLARRSDPKAIGRRGSWLFCGDARFRAARPGRSEIRANRVLTVAAVQMEIRLVVNGSQYTDVIYSLAARAASQGAEFIVFPEYSGLPLLGMVPGLPRTLERAGSLDDAAAKAGGEGIRVLDVFRLLGPHCTRAYRAAFSSVAKALGVHIATGSMILPDDRARDGAMRSVGYIFGPNGEEVGRYSKCHLMPVEAAWGISTGDSVPVFDVAGVATSMPICMDATYFETFRLARLSGADLVAVPSANPEDYNLWYALRGIWPRVQESQVFGIGASMVGTFAGMTFTGRSAILAPLELTSGGDGFIAQARTCDQEEVVVGAIDLGALYRYRAENPLRFNIGLYQKYLPGLYRVAQAARQASLGPGEEGVAGGEDDSEDA
ncbi:MAG: hypothetical protein NUW23_12095, partial [Firmicutes bacterium]|nr:hypothetical protein [Bacillota bacterium]